MKINIENKNKFEQLKRKHLDEGGTSPDEYAITEIIKESIENRNYKLYSGGGYEKNTTNEILKYDVVVWFTWSNDAQFMIVYDEDGDSLSLYGCNTEGKLTHKMY